LKSKINFSALSHIIPHGPISIDGVDYKKFDINKKVKLLFLGRVCHYKGVDLLIESLKDVDPHRIDSCVIAGEISSDQKYLKKIKSTIPLIFVDKWLTDEEIREQLQRVDLLILPYREATQSGVMSIGINCRIPMVSTKVGGLIEQCDESECIFVDPNPKAIAKGINLISQNEALYNNFVEQLNTKNEKLNWKMIATQIEELLTNN
jgi:glycosyltransferase involved in cell wall biosynthesis